MNLPQPAARITPFYSFFKPWNMKSVIFLIAIPIFLLWSCNDEKTTESTTASTSELRSTDTSSEFPDSSLLPPCPCNELNLTEYEVAESVVRAGRTRFLESAKDYPWLTIQQINMDGPYLRALLCNAQGMKIIAAADVNFNLVVYVQIRRNNRYYYYDITSLFRSSMEGMRGLPPVCPPPDGCDLDAAGRVLLERYYKFDSVKLNNLTGTR